jgi:hypothetical protein
LLAQNSMTQKTTLIVHSPEGGPDQICGKELSAGRYQSLSISSITSKLTGDLNIIAMIIFEAYQYESRTSY